MKFLPPGILLLLLISAIPADDIYQYKDKNGTTVFTNKAVKNAQIVNLPPLTVYASPMSKNDYNAKGYTNGNSLNNNLKIYPKLTKANYGTNENGRRQILNEELKHEQQGLTDAEQALTEGQRTMLGSEKNDPKQYQARVQALQDAITEHQKNIEILSKQLDSGN